MHTSLFSQVVQCVLPRLARFLAPLGTRTHLFPRSSALCASSLASVPVTYTARGLWCLLCLCPDVLLPRTLGKSAAVYSWTALVFSLVYEHDNPSKELGHWGCGEERFVVYILLRRTASDGHSLLFVGTGESCRQTISWSVRFRGVPLARLPAKIVMISVLETRQDAAFISFLPGSK